MEVRIKPSSYSQPYPTRTLQQSPFIPTPKLFKPIKPKTSLKPLSLSNSLKTSFNVNHGFYSQHEENIDAHQVFDKIPEKFNLPVVVRHSGNVSRYFWDGNELNLVSVDGINSISLLDFTVDFGDGVRKLGRVCGAAVRNFFLPREVSGNYLEYVKWKFLHRVFSSALQVLATQAMFRAIGIGYSRSLPSAAALNWVLKDGLGRLSRCIYPCFSF